MSDARSKGQEQSAALALEMLYQDVFGESPKGKGYHKLGARIQEEVRNLREENLRGENVFLREIVEDNAVLIKALKEANEMWDKKSREKSS